MKNTPLVLILDNDDDELVDFYSFLDREGYLVATRTHPLEALKYACEHKPDIVVIGGPFTAPVCKSTVDQMRAISPRSYLLVVRCEDDAFAPCGLAADPHVTILRDLSPTWSVREIAEALRKISSVLPLSA